VLTAIQPTDENFGARRAIDIVEALTNLLDERPETSAQALDDLMEAANHQNSIYPVTPAVATYITALLPDPRTEIIGPYSQHGQVTSLRAALLDWLGSLADDTGDESLAAARRHGFGIGISPQETELRAMRPAYFRVVTAFFDDPDAEVRHAAVVTALLLLDTPQEHRRHEAELARPVAELLVTSTDWRQRARALDTLDAWGQDTTALRQAEPSRLATPWERGDLPDPWRSSP
jgi:hypothetical protein